MGIEISDQRLVRQIESIARRERRQPIEVIADAVRIYRQKIETRAPSPSFLLAIAGLGASGQGDVAERAEEILAEEAEPPFGWTLHDERPA